MGFRALAGNCDVIIWGPWGNWRFLTDHLPFIEVSVLLGSWNINDIKRGRDMKSFCISIMRATGAYSTVLTRM